MSNLRLQLLAERASPSIAPALPTETNPQDRRGVRLTRPGRPACVGQGRDLLALIHGPGGHADGDDTAHYRRLTSGNNGVMFSIPGIAAEEICIIFMIPIGMSPRHEQIGALDFEKIA